MIKPNNKIWAKKSLSIDGLPKWLPLSQHLMDTKFVINMLYDHYLSENQRILIRNSISSDNDDVKKLISFIALTHDFGKASPAFQAKKSYQGLKDLDQTINDRLIKAGLFDSNNIQKPDYNKSPHALAGESLLYHYGVNDEIRFIIGGHHGKPSDDYRSSKDQMNMFEENYYFNDSVKDTWKSTRNVFFQWALDNSGFSAGNEIPRINGLNSQVILEGLLVMADWISSNSEYFPLFNIDQFEPTDSKRNENGWSKWFETFQWTPENFNDSDDYYQERFGFKPREFQDKLFKIIDHSDDTNIVIVEAGMGRGKTEAALAATEQLALKDDVNGLFWALPSQATANAIFGRIERWCKQIAIAEDSNVEIQLVHGKSALNDNFTRLPHHIDIDENAEAEVLVNEWFSGPKTAILDDFVVGTIDQLLLLALKKKHLELRHLGFSKKVVVIDEAHSFDAYMQQYLYRALYWLGKYRVPVVILSATLPSSKRTKMIKAYQGKVRSNHNKDSDAVTDNSGFKYPLITYNSGKEIKQFSDFSNEESRFIDIIKIEDDDLSANIQTLLSDGGIIGIIVNTVKRAQKIAKNLMETFGEEQVELIHSSFIATDRSKKESELINMIGKNGKRPKAKIIIGTQVLEQSLDIDFDALFSDLAPMDLLIQRVGRLQRHRANDSKRPLNLKQPKLYLMQTSTEYDFDSGASFIYSDFLLLRTQHFLPSRMEIPTDIPRLVEYVYNFDEESTFDEDVDSDNYTADFKNFYENAKKEYQNLQNDKEYSAKSYMLNTYGKRANLIGWLNNNKSSISDADGLAQVRDGEDSVEVVMLWQNESGYKLSNGKEISLEDIEKPSVAKEIATNTIKLPLPITQNYNIDRTIRELEKYNNAHLRKWQNQSWLKGQLGILLDDNNQFELNDYKLKYDHKLGLMYEKE